MEQLTLGTDKRNCEEEQREEVDLVFIDTRLIEVLHANVCILLKMSIFN